MNTANRNHAIAFSAWLGACALLPATSLGHHSHANYLEGEWLNLEGTVREIHWMNPHSWIFLDVEDESGQP
ncbi:MAG TPA: DUF6152 family protein, partial [Gammaproteobacteria bacterium]